MKQTNLTFACPLKAGKAVYRARTMLRTKGNCLFDDTALCQINKNDKDEEDQKRTIPEIETAQPKKPVAAIPQPR